MGAADKRSAARRFREEIYSHFGKAEGVLTNLEHLAASGKDNACTYAAVERGWLGQYYSTIENFRNNHERQYVRGH